MQRASRAAAAAALAEALRTTHPERGFLCHPALAFEEHEKRPAREVVVRATAPISAGEILLVVPEEARLSTRSSMVAQSTVLREVLADVRARFSSQLCGEQDGCMMLTVEDAEMAVVVMRTIRQGGPMVNAWPTPDDLDHLPLSWSGAELQTCRGHALRLIRRHRTEAARIFQCVITPSLEGRETHFKPPHLSLRHAYYWALCLITSRAHEHSDGGAVLSPLLDLFDGTPDGPAANVEVHRGFWPFVRGAIYRNECDLKCTAASAARDIASGEALVVSYGQMSSAMFLLKYGWVPEDEAGWENAEEVLSLTLDPALLPPGMLGNRDGSPVPAAGADLRLAALRHLLESNRGHEEFSSPDMAPVLVVDVRVDMLTEFAASGLVKVGEVSCSFLRQVLILLVARPELLQQFLATETFKTGGWDHEELLRALDATLKYTLSAGARETIPSSAAAPTRASDLVARMARRDEALLRRVLDAISTPEVWQRYQAARNRNVRLRQAVALAVVAALLWWLVIPLVKLVLSWIIWPFALILGRADETVAPVGSLEAVSISAMDRTEDHWGGDEDKGWATLG